MVKPKIIVRAIQKLGPLGRRRPGRVDRRKVKRPVEVDKRREVRPTKPDRRRLGRAISADEILKKLHQTERNFEPIKGRIIYLTSALGIEYPKGKRFVLRNIDLTALQKNVNRPLPGRKRKRVLFEELKRLLPGYEKAVKELGRWRFISAEYSRKDPKFPEALSMDTFTQRMFNRIRSLETERTSYSAAFIDLDRLKKINDFFGHMAGDEVIGRIIHELNLFVKKNNGLLAKFGGDEFPIFCPIPKQELAAKLVDVQQKISRLLADPTEFGIRLSGRKKNWKRWKTPTMSIGVSGRTANGIALERKQINDIVEDLKHEADSAMYTAKKRRNRITIYKPTMRKRFYLRIAKTFRKKAAA